MIAPYLMALVGMTFAALSAFTLVSWIDRFDPPEEKKDDRKAA